MPKVSIEYEQAQRERIIEGAAQSFADKGYRQTSIDEIARNLGISKGAIYIYFKSKEELFIAIFEDFLCQSRAALKSSFNADGPLQARLSKLLDTYLSTLFDVDPVRSRLLLQFWLESTQLPELQRLHLESKRADHDLLVKTLDYGKTTGEVRANINTNDVSEIILATCQGLILNNVTGCARLSRAEVRQAVWNTFAAIILPTDQPQL